MSKTDDNSAEQAENGGRPAPGPGVTSWLSGLLGDSKPVSVESAADMPVKTPALELPMSLTALLPDGEIDSLRRITVRDLADGIGFSHGTDEGRGKWTFSPGDLPDLQALIFDPSILPHTLTLRADFQSDDDAAWTEVLSFTLRERASGHLPGTLPKIGEAVPEPSTVKPNIFFVTDLDVSLGIDDPDVLADVELVFSGLPDGGSITGGAPDKRGVWRLAATALDNLAAIVPVDTQAFDLSVAVAGSEDDEAASFPIVSPHASPTCPQIRIGPPSTPEAMRFKIFADGVQVADLLVDWTDAATAPVEVAVPMPESGELPFEILIRYGTGGSAQVGGPLLIGLSVDGKDIPSDAPGIVARGSLAAGGGKCWQGDLVISVREALRSVERDHSSLQDLPPKPEPPHIESDAAQRTLDVVAEADASETVEEPNGETDDVPTLVLRTAPDDIRRPEFLRELNQLGSFIRSPDNDDEHRVYERLGLDVGRWRDMAVFGPTGAPVDTAPMIPTVAPPGGRDNARGFSRLNKWYKPTPDAQTVMIEGLPPGSMLSHGTNLGDGRWRLSKEDVAKTSVIGPFGEKTTVPATITGLDERGDPIKRSGRLSVLMGTIADSLRPESHGMRTVSFNLSKTQFDPKDYGTLSLTIGDMPPGSLVIGGSNHGGGVWTLETVSDSDLHVASAGQAQPFELTLTCIALNNQTGESSVVTRVLKVIPNTGTIEMASSAA